MPTKIIMPQLGESVVEGTVTKWLLSEGDELEEFDSLLEVNTDKVDTEIPSPASGTLLKILVSEGETVNAGTVLGWVGDPGETIPDEDIQAVVELAEVRPETESQVSPDTQVAQKTPTISPGRDRDLGFISPVVAKIAAEHNVDLFQVKGTGRGERITKKDVLAFIEGREAEVEEKALEPAPAAWETPGLGDLFRPTEEIFGEAEPADDEGLEKPKIPAATPGEVIPLTAVRQAIAKHMVMSKHTSPHVTTIMEADLGRVVAHRQANKEAFEADGVKLTFTPYFVAASVAALKATPIVNSSFSEDGILVKPNINIGVATSLGEEGLIVPVIKGADSYSLLGLARAVNDLSTRARSKQLKPEEVQGGTFTITNHGVSGSLFATPIINQPQSAILGVGVIQKRVVVINDAIAIRPMVYLTLTFDHRVLDGAIGDYFLGKLVETLQNWS
ncbi:MAG: dihydrolipoamide acetyltransferase family protein [Anaerolineales bacterium]|jgi:2-oxoglutarate dehydrogenase E2 component (dihydrolipoamide succinyltransferase)